MINTIHFDMDGVICHTNPYHSIAFQEFFRKRDMNPTEAEFGEHMYGKNNSYIFSHFFGRPIEGEELLAFENEKEGLFREIYAPHVEPIKGFLPFLESSVDKGLRLGVATSAPKANMDLIIDKLGIRECFKSLLASEDVTSHKPDPQVYLKSARNLNAQPKECIVFEDSYSGVSAALNAKMSVVGVLSSHSKEELPPCDYHIDEYSKELFEMLFQ